VIETTTLLTFRDVGHTPLAMSAIPLSRDVGHTPLSIEENLPCGCPAIRGRDRR
jgi:hypothetical protein